ncbi:uncharacterized protein F5Z01DRAFT_131460 [Emericellopsis atlantica]|uniref:Uncharacterized protein n=1 Tax=Emericellopsis atlantica TaxID=2614577 RepID=A0A9P8CP79_9HYPO|nr:uncharacterized protein F5Z01DRAFT_131460 [Emericellopsis atlantica]KAG9253845.1 hypothetical protein F5Z01DRAFT_131460 [Emericellopsis atlantica]
MLACAIISQHMWRTDSRPGCVVGQKEVLGNFRKLCYLHGPNIFRLSFGLQHKLLQAVVADIEALAFGGCIRGIFKDCRGEDVKSVTGPASFKCHTTTVSQYLRTRAGRPKAGHDIQNLELLHDKKLLEDLHITGCITLSGGSPNPLPQIAAGRAPGSCYDRKAIRFHVTHGSVRIACPGMVHRISTPTTAVESRHDCLGRAVSGFGPLSFYFYLSWPALGHLDNHKLPLRLNL